MNHFFNYIDGKVDVFQDSDYIESETVEKQEDIAIIGETNPEIEEAIRFLRGENISFEEVLTRTSSREGLHYTAYIHTRNEVDIEVLKQKIADVIEKRMKEGTHYTLTVERDLPISYAPPSRKDYIVKIKVE